MSIDEKKIKEIYDTMSLSSIKSRSKFISNALDGYLQRQKILSELKGYNTVVFTITHEHAHKSDVTSTIHGYEHVVKTVVHHHSQKGCLDILIAEGDAQKIKNIYKRISAMSGVGYVYCAII